MTSQTAKKKKTRNKICRFSTQTSNANKCQHNRQAMITIRNNIPAVGFALHQIRTWWCLRRVIVQGPSGLYTKIASDGGCKVWEIFRTAKFAMENTRRVRWCQKGKTKKKRQKFKLFAFLVDICHLFCP